MYHFILICPQYYDLRIRFIKKYYYIRPSMLKLVKLFQNQNLIHVNFLLDMLLKVVLILCVHSQQLRSCRNSQLTYQHCSKASLPEAGYQYLVHILSPLTDMLFLNQRKRKNGRRNNFMTKSSCKHVSRTRGSIAIATGRAIVPGHLKGYAGNVRAHNFRAYEGKPLRWLKA